MTAQCAPQPSFTFRRDRQIRVDFAGGQITSDAGLVAVREFDQRIGLSRSIVRCLRDERSPSRVVHSLSSLVIQRLYALVAGYEDQNDAHRLRHDGLFQLIAGRPELGDPLASQPTLSRFENAISATEVGALNDLLVDSFIAHTPDPPRLIIELDSTDDPAHGQQQLIGFNGFYDQWMYHPLLIHEGVTGCILGTFLRPGNAHPAESELSALRPIVARLRQAFPHTPIYLRADSGFEGPKLYEFCQREGIDFTIAAGANPVYRRRTDQLLQQAVEQYHRTGRKARLYDHFAHQAQSWDGQLRVIAKAEAGAEGINRRFVVTNRPGDAPCLFNFYEARGQHENLIKELKLDLKADRLSCHRFEANCFRLVLCALAYQLLTLFRRRLSNPGLRKATVGTLRERLFKVGALLRPSTRRFWLHLSSAWPNRDLLLQALADVGAIPAPG